MQTKAASLTAGALMVVAIVSSATAQSPVPGATSQTAEASTSRDVTVIGCLVRIDRSNWRPGTTGSTPPGGSVKDRHPYALKEAAIWAESTPPSGSVATHSDQEFALSADPEFDFESHANHQVEVKGQVSSPGSRDIHVTSIRTISEACPPR